MSALKTLAAALALGLAFAAPARAEKPAKDTSSAFGNIGGGGKEPIKIDADRLDVFDKENKAIFAGNVVAVQGESTIRCTTMTVYYKRGKDKAEGGDESAPKNPAENGIKKVECAGPVTVTQKDQVATGDNAVFDQDAKRIVLTGNVVLSQCQNVTRGQRLVYDMASGRANMDPVAGGRVSAMFVPGEKSDGKDTKAKGCTVPPAKPRAQAN
ncbi:LptA/OstA family protein [Methylobacterium sp. J-067]|uniref:LptA/OstA family protein n=1 Tax=Methylobacterium sp. J-067 TaxID=2836648 RepID=UPI001FB8A4DD|nr:LptA/OstA family protein [Methylobacterium sp. J-067]MCJ2026867.1 organic solvent tolerance protein OstA [Methylobacterium sp. J-067]